MKTKFRPRCYFDIEIGRSPAGRIVFELYNDICPITVANFEKLCTGETKNKDDKVLHYTDSPFHRVIKGFMIQGGDFTNGDGTGGESIYGSRFDDENFAIRHDKPFLLSMANCGPNTNGSQFFITTKPAPHLDGKHVVFGHVVSGENLIESIENLPVNENKKPIVDATIKNSGKLVAVLKKKPKKKKEAKDKGKEKEKDKEIDNSDTSSDEKDKKHKKKKSKKKNKKKLKLKKKSKLENEDDEEEINPNCSVRPDEIPEVPKPYYLYRGNLNDDSKKSKTKKDDGNKAQQPNEPEEPTDKREDVSKSFSDRKIDHAGRTTKGRGILRYRPSPARGDETPPYWRKEERSKAVISSNQPSASTSNYKSNDISKRRFPSSDMSEKEEKENYQFVESTVHEPLPKKYRPVEKSAHRKVDKPEAYRDSNKKVISNNFPKEEMRRSQVVPKINEVEVESEKMRPTTDLMNEKQKNTPNKQSVIDLNKSSLNGDLQKDKPLIPTRNEVSIDETEEHTRVAINNESKSSNTFPPKQLLLEGSKARENSNQRENSNLRENSNQREKLEPKELDDSTKKRSRDISYDKRRHSRSRHKTRSRSVNYSRKNRRRSSSHGRRSSSSPVYRSTSKKHRKSKSPPAYLVERWRNRRIQIRGAVHQLRSRRSGSNKNNADNRKANKKNDLSYRYSRHSSRSSTGTADSSDSSSAMSSRSNKPSRIDSDLSDHEKNVNTQSWINTSTIDNLLTKEQEKSSNTPKIPSGSKETLVKSFESSLIALESNISQPQLSSSSKPLLILKQKGKPVIQNKWKDEDSNDESEQATQQKPQSILEKLKEEDSKKRQNNANQSVKIIDKRLNSEESRSVGMSQSISKLRSPSGTRSPIGGKHSSSSSSSSGSSPLRNRKRKRSIKGRNRLSQQALSSIYGGSSRLGGHRKLRDGIRDDTNREDTNRSSSYHKRSSRRHYDDRRRSRSRSSRSSRSTGYRRFKRSRSSRRSYGTRSRSRDRRRDSYSRSSRSSSESSDGSSSRHRRYRRARR